MKQTDEISDGLESVEAVAPSITVTGQVVLCGEPSPLEERRRARPVAATVRVERAAPSRGATEPMAKET